MKEKEVPEAPKAPKQQYFPNHLIDKYYREHDRAARGGNKYWGALTNPKPNQLNGGQEPYPLPVVLDGLYPDRCRQMGFAGAGQVQTPSVTFAGD